MNAFPVPENETERLQALHRYNILDTLPEKDFDDITLLAAAICETPIAVISLVDEARQWFKSRVGLSASETARDIAFCNHTIRQDEPFIVTDALADPRFATNPLVTTDPHIRFYAGVQLTTPDGYHLGAFCAIDRQPRQLRPDQITALQALARQVISQLELRRVSERLQQVNTVQEKLIGDLQDVLHRIKRLEGIISICSHCKKIRDHQGYWQQLETYLRDHSEADFSHGFCPDCMNIHYPDLYRKLQERREDILTALRSIGPANLQQIAAAVDLPEDNTLNRLQALVKEGEVQSLEVDQDTLYRLPQPSSPDPDL